MPQIPGQMQLPIQGQPPQAGQRLSRFGRLLWANRADVTDPTKKAAKKTWNRGTLWSRVALWFLVIATILIPLVALSGKPAAVALVGLVPLAGLLAVFLRPHGVSPLWGGAIAYWPERIGGDGTVEKPKKGIRLGGNELRLDARRVSGILFTEALLAEYYALMEYAAGKADVTLIFVSFVLFVTAGLGVGAQPGKLRSIGLPVVALAILGISIVFALGGKSGIEAIGNNDAKAAPAAKATAGFQRDESGNLVAVINLPVDGSKTEPAIDTRSLPRGRWEADLPKGTLVCWEDEPCAPAGDFSRKGKLRFVHPGGGVMTFTVIPAG